MSGTPGRATPVKMIWMFVSVTVTLACAALIFTAGRSVFPMLSAAAEAGIPLMLLSVGAYVCLSRGVLNLALPGIACLSGMLVGLIFQSAGTVYPAFAVAIVIGAGLGALTGLFSIQSSHKTLLVTAAATLLFSILFFSVANMVSDGRVVSVRSTDRTATAVFSWVGFFIAAGVAILGSLGRHDTPLRNTDAPPLRGGVRFLWTFIAGILAGLAGAVMMVRLRGFQPVTFSNYNDSYLVPVLLLAGILIPNARRSTGEAIFAGVSVIFASLSVSILNYWFSYLGLMPYLQRLILSVFALLLLIPNLAICRNAGKQPLDRESFR